MDAKEFDIALGQLMGKRLGTVMQDPDSAPVTTVVLEAIETVHAFGKMFTKQAVARMKKQKRDAAKRAEKGGGAGAGK